MTSLLKLVGLALVACGVLLIQGGQTVSGAAATLRIDPANQTVAAGTEFTVKIVQNADVATTGAQASVRFDPAVVEIVDVKPGAPYAAAQVLFPGSKEQAIAGANSSGLLDCVATFFVPGSGSASPGDAEFLLITMRGRGGGTSTLAVVGEGCGAAPGSTKPLEVIDENGSLIPTTSTNGSVTISGGAAPPPPPPAATPTVLAGTPTTAIGEIGTIVVGTTPAPGTTAVSTVLSDTAAPSTTLGLEPNSAKVEKGEQFEMALNIDSAVEISAASVQISYDPDVVELEEILPGDAWAEASGASEDALATIVEQAGETGSVEAVFSLTGSTAQAGELLTLGLRGQDKDATSEVRFVSVELTAADGSALDVELQNGEIIVGSGGGGGASAATLSLAVLLLLAIGGTGGAVYYVIKRRRRQWAA